MARQYYINGQAMVNYNGSQLGLTDNNGRVTITPTPHHLPIEVDGFFQCPPERQCTLVEAFVSMTLVHFDISIFEEAMANSTQGATEGILPYGGTLLGANNGYGTLLINSPVLGRTWTFPAAYIRDNYELPVGAERSLMRVTWHCVGYVADPWNNSQGSSGITVYT
jgi:hypothetical protein